VRGKWSDGPDYRAEEISGASPAAGNNYD